MGLLRWPKNTSTATATTATSVSRSHGRSNSPNYNYSCGCQLPIKDIEEVEETKPNATRWCTDPESTILVPMPLRPSQLRPQLRRQRLRDLVGRRRSGLPPVLRLLVEVRCHPEESSKLSSTSHFVDLAKGKVSRYGCSFVCWVDFVFFPFFVFFFRRKFSTSAKAVSIANIQTPSQPSIYVPKVYRESWLA